MTSTMLSVGDPSRRPPLSFKLTESKYVQGVEPASYIVAVHFT